eukprot:3086019-Rhodomonas_salina.2
MSGERRARSQRARALPSAAASRAAPPPQPPTPFPTPPLPQESPTGRPPAHPDPQMRPSPRSPRADPLGQLTALAQTILGLCDPEPARLHHDSLNSMPAATVSGRRISRHTMLQAMTAPTARHTSIS